VGVAILPESFGRCKMDEFVLQHVIAEDCGQCFGEALVRVATQLMKEQVLMVVEWPKVSLMKRQPAFGFPLNPAVDFSLPG
jgi:hypothetical protein